MPAPTTPEQFWARVERGDGCWLWQGMTISGGYGRVGWRGMKAVAHRVAWELTYGPIPEGLWVLHRCDNPPCCNPEHLFLGSRLDNIADMVAKGRGANRFTHQPQEACFRGHPYATSAVVDKRGKHRCRLCDAAHARAYYRQNAERIKALKREQRRRAA